METRKRGDPCAGLAARQKTDLVSDTGCTWAVLLLSTNYQIHLPFLLPENKLGLLRLVPPPRLGSIKSLLVRCLPMGTSVAASRQPLSPLRRQPSRQRSWLRRLPLGAPKWQLEKSALI